MGFRILIYKIISGKSVREIEVHEKAYPSVVIQ